MARKSAAIRSNVVDSPNGALLPLRWINIKFEPSEIETVIEFGKQPEKLGNILGRVLLAGYDITVKYDSQRQSYSAFAVLSENPANGDRIGISAYAKSRLDALAAILVKLQLYTASPERFTSGGTGLGIG